VQQLHLARFRQPALEVSGLRADSRPRSAGTCQGWPMRWIDRLNMAQRVVLVITLGLALGIVASYLTGLGVRTGWYAYAPVSGQLQPPGIGEPGWLRLVIWLAAVSLWALTSLRVLSQSSGTAARG